MNSSSSSGRSSPISCPSTRVGDIVSLDRSTDDECMKSKRRNETRPLFNKILTMVGNKAPLIFVVTLLVTLWCGYREFSAIALRGAETYRALMEWNGLSSGVYRAFVGDQKVMEQQLASSFPDHAGRHGGDKKKKTRGILIPAGGKNQMLNAFVNLYVLRHRIGCRLPVTIAYWGDLEKVKNHTLFDRHMDSPSVSFLDLSTLAYPRHHRWLVPPNPDGSSFWNGFKIKVFALYASPYDQVVLMDSDAMAAQDPEGLFRHPDFVKKGNMFWPDRWCTRVKLFSMLGMGQQQQQQQYQTDSGQFLFDKTRHPDVLEWLLFLNTHDEFTYRYAHGDKDTYRAAFYMAGKEDQYVLVHQPLSVGLSYGGFFRSSMPQGFIQHHPDDGSIAFIHRTSQAKYSLGDEHGRTFTHMLLQPSCEWNRRYWHFFRPMVHSVPVLEKPKGKKKKPAKEVVIVKIDPSSDIAAYQYTADEAAHLYRSEYSSRDDGRIISRNETTWLVHITLEVVCVLCVLYLLSIGLRMVLRRFYCQDRS